MQHNRPLDNSNALFPPIVGAQSANEIISQSSERPTKNLKVMKAGPAADLFSNSMNERDPLVSKLNYDSNNLGLMNEKSSATILRNDEIMGSHGRRPTEKIELSKWNNSQKKMAASVTPGSIPNSLDGEKRLLNNLRGAEAESSVLIPEQSSMH